ncbi:MAG: Gfo/Idh/MocA family protein [Candidatus Latescibacterota bacterium]|jgi:predicted dehydrogenase
MSVYRAAIIGCGRIGGGYGDASESGEVASHASGYTGAPSVELVAAADADKAAMGRFGERWCVGNLYGDYEEMLEAERVDIVSVCTWDEAHTGAVRAAVRAGVRAVLCEKPLAPTLAEAIEIVELCDRNNVELFVGYQRRWEPAHRAVRDFIASGQLGDVLAVHGYYVGGLRHNGCAWINLARYLVGDIAQASVMVPLLGDVVDPSVSISMMFACGCSGSLLAADRDAYSVFEIDVLGTRGRVRFSDAGEELETWQVGEDSRYPGFRRLLRSQTKWPKPQLSQALNMGIASIVGFLDGVGDNTSSGKEAVRDMEIVEGVLSKPSVGMGLGV